MSGLVKINDNLVIRGGVPVCKDGRRLAEYLAEVGYKDGDEISIIRRSVLVRLDALASCAGIG